MSESIDQRLVISGINLTEGGTLRVLECVLSEADKLRDQGWHVTALVHKKDFFKSSFIEFIELPRSKNSWFFRIFYEYFYFKLLSRRLKPSVWLSMHDLSPRVTCGRQVVYCHNPAQFFDRRFKIPWDTKFEVFRRLYSFFYRLNIHSNALVVVQQEWLRVEFSKLYKIDRSKILVAHPECKKDKVAKIPETPKRNVFLYPSLIRNFKNFELICSAALQLNILNPNSFELRLTFTGNENALAKQIHSKYAHCTAIKFIGRKTRDEMDREYAEAEVVIFPSLLETWGLPISEGKALNKVLMLADLPYARETVGDYDRAVFFDPTNASALTQLMRAHVEGSLVMAPHVAAPVAEPFASDWSMLMQWVLRDQTGS